MSEEKPKKVISAEYADAVADRLSRMRCVEPAQGGIQPGRNDIGVQYIRARREIGEKYEIR